MGHGEHLRYSGVELVENLIIAPRGQYHSLFVPMVRPYLPETYGYCLASIGQDIAKLNAAQRSAMELSG